MLTQVLGVVYRAISTFITRRAGFRVDSGACTGAVTLIQRFGSALNLNIHLHMLVLDGVYTFDHERPRFHRIKAPTQCELQRLLHTIARRVTGALERQGLLIRDIEQPYLDLEAADGFEGQAYLQLLGDAVHYRIATGPHAGGKALTLRTVPPATTDDKPSTAHEAGFSIDAGTVCQEHEREKLQRLCRYVARPPVSNERLSVNEHSQVVYKLKHPFRNGTTHVVMDPLAFIARLAALVPRPRVNLTRYHGVFAPNFKHRKLIVLRHQPSPRRDPHNPLAPLTWMQRLKRVFNIDIETCPHCGGTLRVIASIEDPTVIETILAHIALRDRVCDAQPRAPPPAFDDNDAVHLF